MNRSTTGPTEDATAPVDEGDRGSQPVLEVLSTTFSGPGTAVGPVCVCACLDVRQFSGPARALDAVRCVCPCPPDVVTADMVDRGSQSVLEVRSTTFVDQFSGPGRAVDPLCVRPTV